MSACGRCRFCKEGRYGQCLGGGGWIFGHTIDGLQAEYARVPFADNSVYKVPDELSDEQVLFLADILPTSYEVGVLNGMVTPGDVVAIVGAGPIGLAAILTARLYTPGRIVAIDLDDSRLESAVRFGADTTINNGREDAVARVMELTDGLGADVSFEAVGVPQTFELATELIRPCGRVANIGVHGEPATLHLEKLWIRDVTVTTGLVDTYTIPRLMKLVASGRLDPTIFATHRFALGDTMAAYDTFADAAYTGALKVVLEGSERDPGANGHSSPRASWPGPHDRASTTAQRGPIPTPDRERKRYEPRGTHGRGRQLAVPIVGSRHRQRRDKRHGERLSGRRAADDAGAHDGHASRPCRRRHHTTTRTRSPGGSCPTMPWPRRAQKPLTESPATSPSDPARRPRPTGRWIAGCTPDGTARRDPSRGRRSIRPSDRHALHARPGWSHRVGPQLSRGLFPPT